MAARGTCILFVSCPNAKVAGAIARHLVDAKLAACGNITAPVTFVFTVPTTAGPISLRFPIGSAAERVVISYSGSRWDGKGGIPVQATVLVSSSTIFKYATTVSGNVDKNTTFGAVSNVPSRANVRTDIAHWYPLVDASTIMASFDVSRSTIIDLP